MRFASRLGGGRTAAEGWRRRDGGSGGCSGGGGGITAGGGSDGAPAQPAARGAWQPCRPTAHRATPPLYPRRLRAACLLQDELRYSYFKQTVQKLIARLASCPRSLFLGLNDRADWSPNELRLNRKVFVPPRKPGDAAATKGGPLPAAWDWRRRGLDKVTPAKDQGRCGSCFAFAAAAAVESKLLIQYNKSYASYQIDLAEQAIVDCVNAGQGAYLSTGCAGGYLEEPLSYASRWVGGSGVGWVVLSV